MVRESFSVRSVYIVAPPKTDTILYLSLWRAPPIVQGIVYYDGVSLVQV